MYNTKTILFQAAYFNSFSRNHRLSYSVIMLTFAPGTRLQQARRRNENFSFISGVSGA